LIWSSAIAHPPVPNRNTFDFLVDCVRAAIGPDRAPPGALDAVDWPRFEAAVERHRVGGLVWRALGGVQDLIPPEVAARLSAHAQTIARDNLFAAAECAGLTADFADAGVSLVHLKGLAISALAFGDPFVKMSADIDLLVAPASIPAAARLLDARGYRCVVPSDRSQLARWHHRNKESVWVRSGPREAQIDLHSALSDSARLLAGVAMPDTPRAVPITDSINLATLHRDETFAYLCVHGASSAWFRLKWIADLYALHHRDPVDELERLFDRAVQLGAGHAAGTALLLAERLFGLDLGSRLQRRIAAVRAHRLLAAIALRQLRAPVEPTERLLGTVSIHLTGMLVMPGLRAKAGEAWRQLAALRRRFD
jgi:hypothetical protein